MKFFKNKTDVEFTLVQKINFTQEEFLKILATAKSHSQTPCAKKVTEKPKKRQKRLVVEVEDKDADEANKENIDPIHQFGGSYV